MRILRNRLFPNFLKVYVNFYKENGLKLTIKKYGIKLILTVFIFYLINYWGKGSVDQAI